MIYNLLLDLFFLLQKWYPVNIKETAYNNRKA